MHTTEHHLLEIIGDPFDIPSDGSTFTLLPFHP